LPDRRQIALIHTLISNLSAPGAIKRAIFKLVGHHALEDISLIINIVKDVFPENVKVVMGTRKPSTHIHRQLAKAATARATTNTGNIELTRTMRDSAARRSRNSHRA
jgi:hypothetical protein